MTPSQDIASAAFLTRWPIACAICAASAWAAQRSPAISKEHRIPLPRTADEAASRRTGSSRISSLTGRPPFEKVSSFVASSEAFAQAFSASSRRA